MIQEGYSDKGIYYRYIKIASGRPTLVFIHGFTGSMSAWSGYEADLQKKYDLLFFDWRGHGKSKKCAVCNDYAIGKTSQDLLDLLDNLQITSVIFISHSYGSLVALDLFSRRPRLAMAFVFLAPDNRIGEALWIRVGEFLFSKIPDFFNGPLGNNPGAHLDYSRLPTGDWSFKRILADIRNTNFRTYCCYFRQINRFNAEKILPSVNIPALIIHGDKDLIYPVKNSILLAKKIKNAFLKILSGANHILVLNNTSEIVKAVDDFVVEVCGGK
ncbi:MAG: alpha/beta hydrolase [Candidatus Paceibacterota bacterium]